MELILILIILLQITQTFFDNYKTILLVSTSLLTFLIPIKDITFGIIINYLYDTLKSFNYKPRHNTRPKLKSKK